MAKLIYGSVLSGGVKIHYYRTGDAKPPIVLLHGLTDNGLCWSRLALELEPFYDLVMVDQRGHGLSEAPERGYSSQEQARDVAEIIRSLNLKKPVIIGHSMGARNAFDTAFYYPDLVGSLILEDPPFSLDQGQESASEAQIQIGKKLEESIIAYHSKNLDELIEIRRTMHPEWDEVDIFQSAKAKQQVNPKVVMWLTEKREPWRELAGKIKCPVLLITADNALGALVTPETAREAAGYWKKSKVVHISGAGHNIRREKFDQYLTEVKGFLKQYAPY
jgi:N-formylmaleamate deformylase